MTNPREVSATASGISCETRIFCANCIHCKLLPSPLGQGRYKLRVRCEAGKWRKPLGEEKVYKYFTVARRSIESCDAYEDMGEVEDFLRDLRGLLPTSDEEYGR
ncbi:MAG: hypothetical protein M0001_16380 [Treponema sp.]|nr:hypothetical protein [Treponema sp.]